MKCSEMIHHLQQLKTYLGDVDVLVDADVWRDTMPRDVTSFAHFVMPPLAFAHGIFVNEAERNKVIIYVGNEPKATIQ